MQLLILYLKVFAVTLLGSGIYYTLLTGPASGIVITIHNIFNLAVPVAIAVLVYQGLLRFGWFVSMKLPLQMVLFLVLLLFGVLVWAIFAVLFFSTIEGDFWGALTHELKFQFAGFWIVPVLLAVFIPFFSRKREG